MSLKELGQKSYTKAHWNDFNGALELLNTAIKKYPKERKLYNNRSFVLLQLGYNNQALEEANFMIENFPLYARSYYRRGEACMEMKRYKEAIYAFEKVLELIPNCEEARMYHREAMLEHLCCNGKYFRTSAMKALNLTNNVDQAEQFLAVGGLSTLGKEEIYDSDEGKSSGSGFTLKRREQQLLNPVAVPETKSADPFTDPSNPYKSNSIWVGNVTENVTQAVLKSIFKAYGEIISVFTHHNNFCGFINYATPAMASNAMSKFPQGLSVCGTSLIIRFPDSNSKQQKKKKK